MSVATFRQPSHERFERASAEDIEPAGMADALDDVGEVLLALGSNIPSRITVKQATAFILAARADLKGRPISLSEVAQLANDEAVARSFHIFLGPTVRTPQAVGWITQAQEPTDRRRKILRLTARGRRIVGEIAGMIG